ncbi:MAG: LacI family DNA-binding transcriptional regulator [Janthinobacterium lividum]
MPVTLKDIAEKTGVSASVVSTVLSGRDNGTFVSESTRQKVRQVAEMLNYTPVRSGRPRGSRRLRRLHTEQFIGIWDPEHSSASAFLIQNLQVALRAYAQEQGAEAEDDFGLRLLTTEDLPRLDSLGIMGIISLSSSLLPREAATAGIPSVMIGETDQAPREMVQVHMDSEAAGLLLGDYLWGLGHRKAVLLAPGTTPRLTRERLAGLQSAWTAQGGSTDQITHFAYDTLKTLEERDQIGRAISSLFSPETPLRSRPTALICHDENCAAVAAQTLAGMGLSVPSAVSLAGFGDTPRLAEALTPPLTVIRQPVPQMAQSAVSALYRLHETAANRPAVVSSEPDICLPGKLVQRASCAPPASA